jgi:two-component system, OmpR family, response regulator
LLDARPLPPAELDRLPDPWGGSRLIVLGVSCSARRAQLLARGCAEVLGTNIGPEELAVRVRQAQAMRTALPRARHVGPLLLDLLHRDARRGSTWLGLHPREFGVLWRLADEPGTPVTRRTLLQDVWRIHHEPETNSVEVHVSRLRGKLALAGCGDLVRTSTTGGYRLEAGVHPPVMPTPAGERVIAS